MTIESQQLQSLKIGELRLYRKMTRVSASSLFPSSYPNYPKVLPVFPFL